MKKLSIIKGALISAALLLLDTVAYAQIVDDGCPNTCNGVHQVPEPSTLLLLAAGIGGLVLWRRMK